MVLWCRQRRHRRPYTEEELRDRGTAENVIASYLHTPVSENDRIAWVRQLSTQGLIDAGILTHRVDVREWRTSGMDDDQILGLARSVVESTWARVELEGSRTLIKQIEEEHLDGPARIAQDRQVRDE